MFFEGLDKKINLDNFDKVEKELDTKFEIRFSVFEKTIIKNLCKGVIVEEGYIDEFSKRNIYIFVLKYFFYLDRKQIILFNTEEEKNEFLVYSKLFFEYIEDFQKLGNFPISVIKNIFNKKIVFATIEEFSILLLKNYYVENPSAFIFDNEEVLNRMFLFVDLKNILLFPNKRYSLYEEVEIKREVYDIAFELYEHIDLDCFSFENKVIINDRGLDFIEKHIYEIGVIGENSNLFDSEIGMEIINVLENLYFINVVLDENDYFLNDKNEVIFKKTDIFNKNELSLIILLQNNKIDKVINKEVEGVSNKLLFFIIKNKISVSDSLYFYKNIFNDGYEIFNIKYLSERVFFDKKLVNGCENNVFFVRKYNLEEFMFSIDLNQIDTLVIGNELNMGEISSIYLKAEKYRHLDIRFLEDIDFKTKEKELYKENLDLYSILEFEKFVYKKMFYFYKIKNKFNLFNDYVEIVDFVFSKTKEYDEEKYRRCLALNFDLSLSFIKKEIYKIINNHRKEFYQNIFELLRKISFMSLNQKDPFYYVEKELIFWIEEYSEDIFENIIDLFSSKIVENKKVDIVKRSY